MEPPNLRLQYARFGPCCRVCTQYVTGGRCTKYDAKVAPNQQCDSFDSAYVRAYLTGAPLPDDHR